MRVRFGILVLVFLAAVSGCGGDDEPSGGSKSSADPSSRVQGPTSELTEFTVKCAEFADTAQKIVQAQTDLYADSGAKGALDALRAELDSLKDGAPAKVRTALTDLGEGFAQAADLVKDSTATAQAEMARLAPKLAAAGKTVTDYIVEKCS